MLGSFDLDGEVAIVTGSTRGIGLAVAEALTDAGASVVISSRDQEACDAVAGRISNIHGPDRAIGIAANISSKNALENLVRRTESTLGPVGILVCNAASNPYYGPMAGISDEQFQKVLTNNILANHWLIGLVTPGMTDRGRGSVIVVSSIGAFVGSEVIGAYNVTKAADLQLVRNLAVELGPAGVRVNAIAPGTIRTEFARALYEDPAKEAALNRITPLGRLGEPEDIAGAALFLAAPASGYLTGQTITVDGGLTIAIVP